MDIANDIVLVNIMPAGAFRCPTRAHLFVLLQQSRSARQHSGFPHRRGSRPERAKCKVLQPFHRYSFCSQKWSALSSFFTSFRSLSFRPAPESGSDSCDDPDRASGEDPCGQRNKLLTPSRTPLPKPAPRITPPPERVKTQAYLPPELPPCGDMRASVPAVSDDGVIHIMTLQAGTRESGLFHLLVCSF